MTDAEPGAPGKPARLGADFGTRVVSAIVMAAVVLGITWFGGWPFAILAIIGSGILLWEWGGMTGGPTTGTVLWVQCATVAGMIVSIMLPVLWIGLLPLWSVVWTAGAVLLVWLAREENREDALVGLVYISLPALALVWFRNDPSYGLVAVLFLFVVVWGTDILAYVCGRYFGGPKLWPAVSPKKTWSGAIGGTTAAVVGGVLVGAMVPDASLLRIAFVALILSIISQIGDLAESAIKRHYDIKDSSGLIPGHGGLLDRVDGLLFATFAAGLFVLVAGPAAVPGKTLLVSG
ncbi:MAG: phosphatidate cytidylyltransferase [Hyphomicrobiaceae bacterium]